MQSYSVQVHVANSDGEDVEGARVDVEIHQFMAGGFVGEIRTDRGGWATFRLEADAGADCTVWLEHDRATSRSSIKSTYYLVKR